MTTTTRRFAQLLRDAQAWDQKYKAMADAQTTWLLEHFIIADNLCIYASPSLSEKFHGDHHPSSIPSCLFSPTHVLPHGHLSRQRSAFLSLATNASALQLEKCAEWRSTNSDNDSALRSSLFFNARAPTSAQAAKRMNVSEKTVKHARLFIIEANRS